MTEQDASTAVEHDPSPATDPAADDRAHDGATGEVPSDETGETAAANATLGQADVTGGDAARSTGDDATPAPRRSSALEREGEVAADFLEQLLDIADMDGDIDVDVEGDRAAVAIVDSEEGRVSRRLVGPDGKVLEALQELTRLAVQAATGERSRLMLDVAGHRAQRRAVLVKVARTAIEQVRSTGDRVAMEPMTAFERKVVHDEVLASGLGSESEGAEPQRYVVILPA